MAHVLLVSKPVAPPWNDSSKNLVRDLATAMQRYEPRVLGRRGCDPELGPVQVDPLYPASAGGFAPGLRDQARVMARLLTGPRARLWHFFFAPNPRSSRAGRFASRLRRVSTVHTVCSAPREDARLPGVLFADRTVVLSQHTLDRFRASGVPEERLALIPPGISPLDPPEVAERARARDRFGLPKDAPVVLFPGDLEFGGGAEVVLEALPAMRAPRPLLVMACREKTPDARRVRAELSARAASLGLSEGVRFVGETPHIHALLGAADVVVLPSRSLYAKMDYPLVILEAMSLARPVIVAEGTPAAELALGGGVRVCAAEPSALAAAVVDLLTHDEARRAQGERARERFLACYTKKPMAEAYEALYDGLLS